VSSSEEVVTGNGEDYITKGFIILLTFITESQNMKEDEQGKERRCVLFQVRRQRQQVQTKY
jgi:hypothetical protein